MSDKTRAEETPLKKMNSDRIREIQETTAYPNSQSVMRALLIVWNECAQQSQNEIDELTKEVERLKGLNTRLFTLWDSLAEIGEIHIGVGFSSTYDKLKEDINQ